MGVICNPNFHSCANKVFGINVNTGKFSLHLCWFQGVGQRLAKLLEQDPLVLGRLANAALPDHYSMARGQNQVD